MGTPLSVREIEESYWKKQWDAGQILDIAATADRNTTALSRGWNRLVATEDCWYQQGGSTVVAVAETEPAFLLKAGQEVGVCVTGDDDAYVSVVKVTGGFDGKASLG